MIFSSVNLQPTYGRSSVFVTWTLKPGFEAAEVYVYRSPTGLETSDDWELLNENDPVSGDTFFVDDAFYDQHVIRKWHYRLLGEVGNTSYDSPIIGMFFEGLNKTEYGTLYTMRRREYLRMRSGNGVKVFHCIPATNGAKAATYDPYLGKNLIQCGDDDALGSNFSQAYRAVFQTWAELENISPYKLDQLPDGGGFQEVQKFNIRLLAFPQPEPGHVIVLPASDSRYIIDGSIKPFLFKGFLPVAWEAEASWLAKSDPRYKLDIPPLLDDPDYPVRFTRAL